MHAQFKALFLLGVPVFVAGVTVAGAADFDRVAYQGLVPPATGTATESAAAGREAQPPGLRLPREVRGRGADVLDVTGGDDSGLVIYSGTRMSPRLGPGQSQAIGGVLSPLAGSWFSTLEASVDAPALLPGRGYGLFGQVHRSLPGGWGVSLGLRYNVYDSGASPLPVSAWEPGTVPSSVLPLHPAGASTATSTGYELRLNYRYGERNTLGFTYGVGSESDYTRQMLGLYPNDGRQFGLIGEHWLTPDWAVSYGFMAQEQIGPVRGQGLRLGLRYRF